MSLERAHSADPEKRLATEDNSIKTGYDDEVNTLQDRKLLRKVDLQWVLAYNELGHANVCLVFYPSSLCSTC